MTPTIVESNGLVEWLTELVGRRLGLAVSHMDLRTAARKFGYGRHIPDPRDRAVMVNAREVEFTAYALLEYFGLRGASLGQQSLAEAAHLFHGAAARKMGAPAPSDDDLGSTEAVRLLWEEIGKPALGDWVNLGSWRPRNLEINREQQRRLLGIAREQDRELAMIAVLKALSHMQEIDLYSKFRECTWTDLLSLTELFSSESALASHGQFFDQRFVNFLASNYEEIGLINWRKFEALTAEYFHRAGFDVDLGPGRGDDGVDIRLWEKGSDRDPASLIIVQCKRERRKIEKVVVKALAADVRWNGATKGLLVATTDWSPGARTVARTRGYPVEEVNGEAVRTWLEAMRTAGAGTAFSPQAGTTPRRGRATSPARSPLTGQPG